MDVRLPERALADPVLDALPDDAYRCWVAGLLYAVGQSTDGAIPRRALRLLNPDGPREDCAALLVERGLWRAADDGWVNVHYQAEQTTSDEVERLRAQARERQRRHRERQREEPSPVTQRVTDDASEPGKRDRNRDSNGPSRVTDRPDPRTEGRPTEPPRVTVTDLSSRDRHRDHVGEARRGEERRGQAAVTATTGLQGADVSRVTGGDGMDAASRRVRDVLGGEEMCEVCESRPVDQGFLRCSECSRAPAVAAR